MFNLFLSYVFLFLLAGGIGLGLGWLTRDLVRAGPRRALEAEIEELRRAIDERKGPRAPRDFEDVEVPPDA